MTVSPGVASKHWSVLVLQELRDAEVQVRRLGGAVRDPRKASEGAAAELSALHHLAEARRRVQALVEGKS